MYQSTRARGRHVTAIPPAHARRLRGYTCRICGEIGQHRATACPQRHTVGVPRALQDQVRGRMQGKLARHAIEACTSPEHCSRGDEYANVSAGSSNQHDRAHKRNTVPAANPGAHHSSSDEDSSDDGDFAGSSHTRARQDNVHDAAENSKHARTASATPLPAASVAASVAASIASITPPAQTCAPPITSAQSTAAIARLGTWVQPAQYSAPAAQSQPSAMPGTIPSLPSLHPPAHAQPACGGAASASAPLTGPCAGSSMASAFPPAPARLAAWYSAPCGRAWQVPPAPAPAPPMAGGPQQVPGPPIVAPARLPPDMLAAAANTNHALPSLRNPTLPPDYISPGVLDDMVRRDSTVPLSLRCASCFILAVDPVWCQCCDAIACRACLGAPDEPGACSQCGSRGDMLHAVGALRMLVDLWRVFAYQCMDVYSAPIQLEQDVCDNILHC